MVYAIYTNKKITPSILSNLRFPKVKATKNVNRADMSNKAKSTMFILSTAIGLTKDDNPNIPNILNILDPSTLPNANWALPLIAANTHVISSGKDVPTATNVIDITASGTPHCLANVVDESISMVPPYMSIANEIIAINHNNHCGFPVNDDVAFSSVSSAALPFCRMIRNRYIAKINNRMKPSNLDNMLVVMRGNIESYTKINSIIAAKIAIGISRRIVSRSILNGCIIAVIPKIKSTLHIFDPTMFPIDISPSPCMAEDNDTNNSGDEVPMPTMVRPITKLEIFALCAIATDESTK